MPPTFFNKIVRDYVPDIIRNEGKNPIASELPDTDRLHHLCLKLLEDAHELFRSNDEREFVAEAADVIEVLLDHGANVNAKGGNGRTPLADAMWGGGDKQVVELLISRGADINAGVLYYAAFIGLDELVKLFIAEGANVNVQFDYGNWLMTPLHTAANWGHTKTAKTLLTAGAKVDVQCSRGMTPLRHAIVTDDDGHNETLKLLIAHGADINEQGADTGQTPLHQAAGNDHGEIAKTLLNAGAKVDIKDKMGRTALAVARQYAHTEIAEMLLEHGAKE